MSDTPGNTQIDGQSPGRLTEAVDLLVEIFDRQRAEEHAQRLAGPKR